MTISDAALDFLAPGLFGPDAIVQHRTASPLRVDVAQAKVRERANVFLIAVGIDTMRDALEKCKAYFDIYEAHRRAKSDHAKVDRNKEMSELCRKALES